MLEFVKAGYRTQLGGEIFREQKRKKAIIATLIGAFAFIILNVLLYSLTKF